MVLSKLKLGLIIGGVVLLVGLAATIAFLYKENIQAAWQQGASSVEDSVNQETIENIQNRLEIQERLNQELKREIARLQKESRNVVIFLNSDRLNEMLTESPKMVEDLFNREIENFTTQMQGIADELSGVENEENQ